MSHRPLTNTSSLKIAAAYVHPDVELLVLGSNKLWCYQRVEGVGYKDYSLVGWFVFCSLPALRLYPPLFSEGTLRFKCLQGGKISSGWGGGCLCVFSLLPYTEMNLINIRIELELESVIFCQYCRFEESLLRNAKIGCN
jgi:hypothetical protein